MNKAFIKETDHDDEEEFGAPPIPKGVKNYLTPEGHQRMKDEFLKLIDIDRPEVDSIFSCGADDGVRSDNG